MRTVTLCITAILITFAICNACVKCAQYRAASSITIVTEEPAPKGSRL
jgi:hypothetical protein